MNLFVNQLLQTVLRAALGIIGDMMLAFIENLKANRADDPELAGMIQTIVSGIEEDHPDWNGEKKFEYAYQAVETYAKNVGRDLKKSVTNTLIELAVQKLRLGRGG